MATPEDLELIWAGFHANWFPEKLRRDLWEYTLTREPYFVKFRGHDLKTRPKINFADPNERGEYPLYRWGQERQSYDLVEKIPPASTLWGEDKSGHDHLLLERTFPLHTRSQ